MCEVLVDRHGDKWGLAIRLGQRRKSLTAGVLAVDRFAEAQGAEYFCVGSFTGARTANSGLLDPLGPEFRVRPFPGSTRTVGPNGWFSEEEE